LDHELFSANQPSVQYPSGDVGPEWANLEVSVNETVVGRRYVEVLVGTRRQLEIFNYGDNSGCANEPDPVRDSVPAREAPVVLEARIGGRRLSGSQRTGSEPQRKRDDSAESSPNGGRTALLGLINMPFPRGRANHRAREPHVLN